MACEECEKEEDLCENCGNCMEHCKCKKEESSEESSEEDSSDDSEEKTE